MRHAQAVELLRYAVQGHQGTWADLGAGEGAFTRALAELFPGERVYAIDRDANALDRLRSWAERTHSETICVVADFTKDFELPGLGTGQLDGVLLANALHYVADPGPVLARLVGLLRPGGRLVIIEYEHRRANPWVPHPVSSETLAELAPTAGFTPPRVTARRPSAFGGDLYVAAMERAATRPAR